MAANFVCIHNAAHGRAHHYINVQLFQLFRHRGQHLRGLIRVLLQLCHLAVGVGMAPGRKQEMPFQKSARLFQNIQLVVHRFSSFLFRQALYSAAPRISSSVSTPFSSIQAAMPRATSSQARGFAKLAVPT